MRAAQDKLRRAMVLANAADDPLHHVLGAVADALGAQHAMHVDAGLMLAELIRRAQQPVSEDSLHRLEQAAVTGADRRAFDLVREHWHRTVLLAAGALFCAAVLFCGGGYLLGRADAFASVRETEAGLRTMFQDGPTAAADWLNLATWNDPKQALALCGKDNTSVQSGRKACQVPLWIEPIPRTPSGR